MSPSMPLFNEPSRRDVVAGLAAVVAGCGSTIGRAEAGREMARGHVFDDTEGTAARSARSGIGGVMVSNGRDVVLTDRDGRWQLPIERGDSVFVIKPTGWSTPTRAGGMPAFSYLYQPDGTPVGYASRFAGVAPTGPLPVSIDFPLRRAHCETTRFDVALVADTQPGSDDELSHVRDSLLSAIPSTGAAFAIHHGDVMGDDLSLLGRYLDLTAATGIPWHHCPGNHDMNLDSGTTDLAFETWKRVFGPATYAFQRGAATFILLNNVERLGPDAGGRGYRGHIGARQLAFVENVLAHVPRDHLVVISMHIPLVNYEDPTNPADSTDDRRRLLALLAGRPHTVSFAGHSHTTEHHYLGPADGCLGDKPHHHHILTAACGSWWSGPRDRLGIPCSDSRDGTPRGFHLLSIDGNRYETRLVATDEGGSGPMRVMLGCDRTMTLIAPSAARAGGHRLSRAEGAAACVLVNVFDGGSRTRVTLEFDDMAGCREMSRRSICDPFVAELFQRHPETCKPWVSASPSSHIWATPLPDGLRPGVHRVSVSAQDEYGRICRSTILLELTA